METANSGFIEQESHTPALTEISSQFVIREELDSHGFCQLVMATKEGKWYVLKGLKPNYRPISLYQQLLSKELDILKSLHHPHIAECYGEAEVEGLGQCIVMEYIDGQSLRDWLQEGRLDNQQIIRIATQLADAILYIHSRQIVHRDLKPENILITNNGQNVKLIDFGFSDTDSYHILKQPAGTRHYMAPEMLCENAVSDMRADIYSFGKILAEMLCQGKGRRARWGQRGRLQKLADKCMLPIDQRIAYSDELVFALAEATRHSRKWIPTVIILGLIYVIAQLSYLLHTSENTIEQIPGTSFSRADADSISRNWSDDQRRAFILALQAFEKERSEGSLPQKIDETMKERERFVLTFTPDSILRMCADDYSLDNEQGFCRKLRDEMSLLGSLQHLPAEVVFGNYSKTQCRDIASFLYDAHANKWQYSSTSLSAPMRDRLLTVYFPEQHLPLMDGQQNDYIVQSLLPTFNERASLCPDNHGDARQLLSALRKKYASFSQWSLTEYAWFLSHYYPLSDTNLQ